MRSKNETTQIILTLPKTQHKKFKSNTAALGKTMEEVLLETIETLNQQECPFQHLPLNPATEKALKNAQQEKNLVKVKNVKELYKKAGIKC